MIRILLGFKSRTLFSWVTYFYKALVNAIKKLFVHFNFFLNIKAKYDNKDLKVVIFDIE